MRKIILDVDTGNDDAIAIMLAGLNPDIELIACTTVWGNLDVDLTTENTLRVLDHIGRSDVPVYRGAGKRYAPIPFDPPRPGNPHVEELPVPPSRRHAEPEHAVEWLVSTLRATTEKLTLVAVAPLTNIALAVSLDPSIVDKVDELVIMGGGHAFGNVTSSAEANIWNDAIAAQVVLAAGFSKITLIPLDATHRAIITREQCLALDALGTPAGTAAARFIGSYMDIYDLSRHNETVPQGAPIHDALCIGYLIDPDVIRVQHHDVTVETMSPLTWGRTIIDAREYGPAPGHIGVAVDADAARFVALLNATLANQHDRVPSPL